MIRIVALLAFVGLVAALLAAPGVSPAQLAVKQAGDLITETVTTTGPDGDPIEVPLWREIFDSEAVTTEIDENGLERRFLRLGGSRFLTTLYREGEKHDPLWHIDAGKSVVRALRSRAAEEGIDIAIEAYKKPDPEGFNLLAEAGPETYRLTATIGKEPVGSREVARSKVSQLSLLPPLVAIFFAIMLRRPVVALFAGVWVGAFLVRWLASGAVLASVGGSFVDVFQTYLVDQLKKQSRTEIILFVVFMLAMVGILTRAGGIRGIMNRIAGLARDARKTQIATWLMG
ncbi:MAG: hypothetical protein AAGG01_07880, partial [Planctomycetota bacterium]